MWLLRGEDESRAIWVFGINISVKRKMDDVVLVERKLLEICLCCACTQKDGTRFGQISRNGLDLVATIRLCNKFAFARPCDRAANASEKRGRWSFGGPRCDTDIR